MGFANKLNLSGVAALFAVALALASALFAPPRAEAYTTYLSATVVNGYEKYSSQTNWDYNRRNKAAGYGYCLGEKPYYDPHTGYVCSTAEYDSATYTLYTVHAATCKNTSGGVISVNCWHV